MGKQDRQALFAVITAVCVLLAGALPPRQGAWWCAAFPIVCREAAEPQPRRTDGEEIEFRWKLAEWWEALGG